MDYDNYGTVGKNVKVVEGTVSTFTDIAGHWAKDAIEYVTDKALFNGTTATTFSPNEGMTRGMFVTVLAVWQAQTSPRTTPRASLPM